MKSKRLLCAVVLLMALALLSGCNAKWANFKKEEIKSLSFTLSYSNGVIKEESEVTDTQVIDNIYQVVKDIKFDQKLPKKDIWTGQENTYQAPSIYHTLAITLKDGSVKYLYIDSAEGHKCYKPNQYNIYSNSGVQLLNIITKYFQDNQDLGK